METYLKHRGNMTALHTQQIVHSEIYGGNKTVEVGDVAKNVSLNILLLIPQFRFYHHSCKDNKKSGIEPLFLAVK